MYDVETFALVETRPEPGRPPGGSEVIAIVCNSCGYVRLFNGAAIVDLAASTG